MNRSPTALGGVRDSIRATDLPLTELQCLRSLVRLEPNVLGGQRVPPEVAGAAGRSRAGRALARPGRAGGGLPAAGRRTAGAPARCGRCDRPRDSGVLHGRPRRRHFRALRAGRRRTGKRGGAHRSLRPGGRAGLRGAARRPGAGIEEPIAGDADVHACRAAGASHRPGARALRPGGQTCGCQGARVCGSRLRSGGGRAGESRRRAA